MQYLITQKNLCAGPPGALELREEAKEAADAGAEVDVAGADENVGVDGAGTLRAADRREPSLRTPWPQIRLMMRKMLPRRWPRMRSRGRRKRRCRRAARSQTR